MVNEHRLLECYFQGLPLDKDAILYYHPTERDVIQYTAELMWYPAARAKLKRHLVNEMNRLLERNGRWVKMSPYKLWANLSDLGIEVETSPKLLPAPPALRLLRPIVKVEYRLIE